MTPASGAFWACSAGASAVMTAGVAWTCMVAARVSALALALRMSLLSALTEASKWD